MDIIDQLKKSGMHHMLMPAALKEEVHKDLTKKMEQLRDIVTKDFSYKVFLIYGEDSPFKDQFAAAVMKWYMVHFGKTGKWAAAVPGMPGSDNPEEGLAGITVFPATYLYSPVTAKIVASVIRMRLPAGRAFVICSTDKEALEATFGKEFFSFISHQALSVDATIPRASIEVL